MKILHITDLHINDPLGSNEALRENFFDEYLHEPLELIKDKGIDYLFITGDIVNTYKTNNYAHAHKIVKFIAEQLSINNDNIYIVNGNHDISRENGDLFDFIDFSNSYGNRNFIENSKEGGYSLHKIDNKTLILCLDSICEEYATGKPRKITSLLADEITKLIKNNAAENIIILSHHPAASYKSQNEGMFDEDNSWSEHHLWSDGGQLLARLGKPIMKKNKIYWFAGDTHRSEITVIDNIKNLITTASLNCIDTTEKTCNCTEKKCNCNSKLNHSYINPQMRIVDILSDKSFILEYKPSGHNNRGLIGGWELLEARKTNINNESSYNKLAKNNSNKDIKKEIGIENKENKENKLTRCNDDLSVPYEVMSLELEKKIFDFVIREKLYTNNYYRHNNDITSLGWISTSRLFDNQPMYKNIIMEFKTIIENKIILNEDKSNFILLGIDNWGSIISSRLGAATNIRNCCLAISNTNESYDSDEMINDALISIIRNKKHIIVICDVINSGNSLLKVTNELKKDNNWTCLTVFYDKTQKRKDSLSKYEKIYFACGKLKLPLISTDLIK